MMKLEVGILLIERRDRPQGGLLRTWVKDFILPAFEDRILVIDTNVALRSANLHVPDPRSERDAFIAATALVHGITVVTRNVADFTPTGVKLLNPWDTTSG